jgi:tripartite-type tricarboxylate transporter receptor subunit TctC
VNVIADLDWSKPMNRRLMAAGLCLICCAPAWADTGTPYPSRPVRFIVPYAPGGSSDVIARLLGQKLAEAWGQAFVVDNRPGAGSMVGTGIAAHSPADGYTVILSDMPHAINPSIHATVPYDPVKDFSPITLVGAAPLMLFVNPAAPARTLKEFIAQAKAQPERISIGSGGIGATTHLLAELLQVRAAIKLNHVPYKGAGPAVADVVAGQIPVTFTSMATAAPYVQSGKLRILAVTSKKRIAALPEVPTFEESGVAGMVVEHWWGVMAPARVPGPIVGKLNSQLTNAVDAPDTRARYKNLGLEPRTSTPEEFHIFLETETQRWAQVVRNAAFKVN